MMSLPKSCGRRLVGVGFERADQDLGVEDVDAHRGEREVRASPGSGSGSAGFSWNPVTRSFSSMATMPKRRPSLTGISMVASVAVGAALLMETQHPGVVHLVDVIARQDDEVARTLADDRVEVLVDGVGRALVPVLADPLLGRQDLDELAQFLGNDIPAHPDVAVERERLVLGGNENSTQA